MTRVLWATMVLLLLASWPCLCPAAEQLLELSYVGPATISIALDIDLTSSGLPVGRAYVRHTGLAQVHFDSMIDYATYTTHRYYFPEYKFGISTLDSVIACQSTTCPAGGLVIFTCPSGSGCGCSLTGAWTEAFDGAYNRTYNHKYNVTARDMYGAAGSFCRTAVMRVSRFEKVDGSVFLEFTFHGSESILGTVSVSWDMPVPVERTTWGSIKSLYR